MKRFLSILLIAASLFGVYGDVVNLKDVLACKSYWEEKSDKSEADLNMLAAGLKNLKKNQKTYLKTVKTVAKGRKALAKSEAQYAAAKGQLASAKSKLKKGKKDYKKLVDLIKSVSTLRSTYTKTWKATYTEMSGKRTPIVTAVNKYAPDMSAVSPEGTYVSDVLLGYSEYLPQDEQENYKTAVTKISDKDNQDLSAKGYRDFASNCIIVSDAINELYEKAKKAESAAATLSTYNNDDELSTALKNSPELYNAAMDLVKYDLVAEDDPKAVIEGAANGSELDLETVRFCASEPLIIQEVKLNKTNLRWLKGYITNTMSKNAPVIKADVEKLLTVQDQIAGGVAVICKTILKNNTYKKGMIKLMGKQAVPFLKEYQNMPNYLSTAQAPFPAFMEKMDKNPGIATILEKAQKHLTNEQKEAKTAYTKANSKYKRSLATYKKTPAKLKTARTKLKAAEKKLAPYEKGEKTAKKGLKALMASEGEGGVTSVGDRVGKENFKDKKGNFDPGKGLDAVSAGEDYLNEVGALVKTEITKRIIGTAAGAVAAVLALLAALLSLLRSNRGGAVLACLAAVAGAAAAVLGQESGMVFSEIAGSTVGSLPWIAAAVLAAVSMVFAVVHFASKIEEE